jgi:hypothetical protein
MRLSPTARRQLEQSGLPDLDRFLQIITPKRGRPPGSRQFEDFDRDVLGLLNATLQRPPRIVHRSWRYGRVRVGYLKTAIREIVQRCWDDMPASERQDRMGQGVESAVLRILKHLSADPQLFPVVAGHKRPYGAKLL